MNQEEWLGTLKYATSKAQDKASVDSLMLRYRPIAPKPTSGPPCAAGDNSSSKAMMNKRTKRKYVRVSKNNKSDTCRGKTRSTISDDKEDTTQVVTLQLMPEKSDLSGEYTPLNSDSLDPTVETIISEEINETDTWMMFNGGLTADKREGELVVETWVTVESVTDVGSLGSGVVECTGVEVMDNLGKDTCPAFVSDGLNRVVWVNEAYRRSVLGVESAEVVVWLVIDESLTAIFCEYGAVTCRVRMEYTWQEMKYTKTVPCDVWRMEFGGFAWRLDTTAALTLWL